MNLERAVEILNREEHEGKTTWRIERDGDGSHWADVAEEDSVILDGIAVFTLSEFEAIAVAEAYERYAGRDMPATRKMMQVYRGFARDFGDCLVDGEIIKKNSAGYLTFGELRAALHEWEDKP